MIFFRFYLTKAELLALTLEDFSPDDKTLRINKSYQRISGRDVITEPKTEKSKRIITLPDFLVEEMRDYVGKLYGMMVKDRLFTVTKSFLEHEMIRGVELSGVKKIQTGRKGMIIDAGET